MISRLLKKAHLRRWLRRSSLQRTSKYVSFLASSPPCIWTFLNSLGVDGVFQRPVGRAFALLLLTGWLTGVAGADPLTVGTKAPNFSLKDQHGKSAQLHDLVGKKYVVLAFYVKAFTRG